MNTIPFQPNNNAAPPFQTTVTLDGQSYALITMWNFYGSRWYVSLTDGNGNLVWYGPQIGSPPNANIYLTPGLFTTSTLLFRQSTQNFEVGP